MPPRVSVVIPTYNRAALLDEAIASVFAQRFTDLELIVVDDGSEDGTAVLLARYGGRLRPIPLAHTGNPATALNAGCRAARGEFVAVLASDDRWLPEKLAQQIALLDATPRAGFAYGNVVFLDSDGRTSPPVVPVAKMVAGAILRPLVRDMFIHPSTLVVRRPLLEAVGGFPESLGTSEDYGLLLQLARRSEAVCVVAPVAEIRRHASQFSQAQGARNYEAAIAALAALAAGPLPPAVRLELHRTLARHHTHLASLHLRGGAQARASDHLYRALRAYPLHRPAWRWAAQALRARLVGCVTR